MEPRRVSWWLGAFALATAVSLPAAAATLHIGGVGAASEPLRQVGATFNAETGITVEIIPGLGSAGGIRAATEGALQLVVSARELLPSETASDLTSVMTVCTPWVLVSSHPSPGSLDHTAVAAIYALAAPQWPDGTPIRIVLRPKLESDNAVMAAFFPGMEQAIAQARMRESVPLGETDQDNADLAERIPGSLTGGAYAQYVSEHRTLRFVAIDGELPGTEAFESGRYPFAKIFRVMVPRHPAPEADRFLVFLRSSEGTRAMRDSGIMACPKSGVAK
jgi:phosphate transport system substrate-binding protein